MDLLLTLITIIVMALLYLPPIYLGWRFFWKRGIKDWAWYTWIASLLGPVGYIVFGIGYLMNRGIQKACPKCGADTHSGKKQAVTLQGEPLKEPLLAWLAMIGGGLLAAFGLIMELIFVFDGEGLFNSFCAQAGMAVVFGGSGVTWGLTELQKVRANQGNAITTYQFKCLNCGHTWERKHSPSAK